MPLISVLNLEDEKLLQTNEAKEAKLDAKQTRLDMLRIEEVEEQTLPASEVQALMTGVNLFQSIN